MKLKHLFVGVLAMTAAVVSCKKTDVDGSNLKVTPETVEATTEQADYTLTVEADCKWAASTSVEWLAVTPSEGTGNATVTVSVLANTGAAREAVVHFQKYDTRKVSSDVTVKQAGDGGAVVAEGDGTKDKPYNAVQANAIGNALADNATTEKASYIRGFVKKIKTQDTETDFQKYHNMTFYITVGSDLTGDDFYCYQMNYAEGTNFSAYDALQVGDDVVLYANITKYVGTSGTATVETVGKGASYLVSINGEETGSDTPEPTEAVDATVAEFLAAEVSTTQYYRLVGTVGGSINTTYGNFDLTDETGTVYVYGLSNIADVKDKLVNNAEITVVGYRGEYSGKIEMLNGKCEKIEGGDTPTPGTGNYDSSIAWTLGTNAYDQAATINGTSVEHVLKLGKSSTAGNATLTIPAGTEAVEFYAFGWNGKTVKLTATAEGLGSKELALTSNSGCAGNAPYTITCEDTDIYTISFGSALEADLTVTVATDAERAILFGINPAGGDDAEHYTIDQVNAADCYIYEIGEGTYSWNIDMYVSQ